MRDADIVSTARTPLAKSMRGAFNATHPVQLGALSVEAGVERAGIEKGAIEDMIIGRQVALRSGLPVEISGMTIDRQCSPRLFEVL